MASEMLSGGPASGCNLRVFWRLKHINWPDVASKITGFCFDGAVNAETQLQFKPWNSISFEIC